MIKIATYTVAGATSASLDFTSIPGTYTDLYLVVSGRSNSGAINDTISITINGSTSNFTFKQMTGSGSAVTIGSGSTSNIGQTSGASASTSTFGSARIYIAGYASSMNKIISVDSVAENNATAANSAAYASLWSNSSAITSISLTCGGSWVQYSTATLYGIAAGSGGGTIA